MSHPFLLEENPTHDAATSELLAYYHGCHMGYLRQALKKRLSEADVMTQVMEAANLVRPLVDLLSPAYTPPPHRVLLGGTPTEESAFFHLLEDSRWDETFDEANRLATLCGVSAIKCAVTGQGRRWAMQALAPNAWWAAAHAETPGELAAFVHEALLPGENGKPRWRTYGYTPTFVYWRDAGAPLPSRMAVFDDTAPLFEGVNDAPAGRMVNRYGRIPVVLVVNRRAAGGVKPPVDETLLSRQQALNLKLTGRNFNLMELGFSQLVLKGQWDKSIRRSVTEPIKVPIERGGDFQNTVDYLTPNPFVAEHHEAIETEWDMAARENGLDPDTLRGRRTSTSGYHQELKDQRLREHKSRQCRRRARDEREAFGLLKAISAAEGVAPLRLSPGVELSVAFSPYRVPRDEAEEWTLLKDQVLMGVRPVDDLVRLIRPDLTGEKAVGDYLASVKERNGLLTLGS